MFTWDDVIDRYKVLEKGAIGLERSTLAGSMVQMLPALRVAMEEQFPNVQLSLAMLAVELRLPETPQAVVVQCAEQSLFELRLIGREYEVLQEARATLPNVVEQVIKLLEISKQQGEIPLG